MTNTFHVDSVDTILTPTDLVLTLHLKAKGYLDALMLDTGLKVNAQVLRKLQIALLEDFVEVQNAALKNRVHLPENKSDLDKLLS